MFSQWFLNACVLSLQSLVLLLPMKSCPEAEWTTQAREGPPVSRLRMGPPVWHLLQLPCSPLKSEHPVGPPV